MSIALDFSNMFRHAPDQQSTSQSCESPADKSDTENVIPPMDSNDLHSWVKNTLRSMNYSLKDEDLTAASLQVWQRVLSERLQWQNQSQSVTEENISLRRKYEILDREKCALKGQVECNQQEISGVQGKMAALLEDQRQLRCHWLAEKNELETRCFQAQALATQFQGTIRKKDKDYEKLQGQLAKMVKDSSRGQKSVIVITKPLPKNFQEQVKTLETLKDVELDAARAVGAVLETENNNLRAMVNSLTSSFEEIQRKLALNNIASMMEHQSSSPQVIAAAIKEGSCSPLACPIQSVVRHAAGSVEEATRLSMSPARPAHSTEIFDAIQMQEILNDIRGKLKASQAIIAEQDTLIHAALLGKLPGLSDATEALDAIDDDAECDDTFDDDFSKIGYEDTIFHMRDFLSPASPATMELLGSAGAFWSPAVPQSHSKVKR